jgi:hypothetical protein
VSHPSPVGSPGGQDEVKQKLIETLGRRRRGVSPAEEARERRSGEILTQASVSSPERGKPKGASSGWPAKHMLAARDSHEGRTQEPRLVEPAPALACVGIPTRETVGGFFRSETNGYLAGGESSEGRIPGALPVRNKTGTGYEGSKPSRG